MTPWRRIAAVLVLAGLLGWIEVPAQQHSPRGSQPTGTAQGPIRITDEELHRHGGTPPGWRFTVPEGDPRAGRAVFIKLECYSCHRVAGEFFSGGTKDQKPGPELSGMGGMHPTEYLAEAIMNPNAVIITGPGYTGPDGLSTMPDYSELLTLRQLLDLVAYLKSLTPKADGAHRGH